MGCRPDWVILNTIAVADRHSNSTTASDITRNGNTIEVSFSLRYPPHPSILFVHSSDMNRALPPTIVFTVDDFLLLSVNMGSGPSSLSPNDCDYFVYRAHATCPSLKLLRRPHPYFNGFHAGLLPRPDGHYTVAALIPTGTFNQYELHLFHSESAIQGWRSFTVFVEAPQRGFPVKIPPESSRLHRHYTSKVITVGGKYGTMGWVDLWRGILFCDVLHPTPSLRGVPLPLPSKELSYNHGRRFTFGPAGQRRGISFIRGDTGHGYLKLVHLEIRDVYLTRKDAETGAASFRVDNWVLTTWSNTRMTDSYDDWHQDNMIQGSDIIIDDPAISHVLDSSGLLPKQLGLHNLSLSQPALSLNGEEEVVYLVARKKYRHVGSWIVAVDVKNGKVQALERFGDQSQLDSEVIYCPSMISKYMDPATTPGCRVDGDKQSGAEDCEDDQEMDAVVQGRSKGAVGGLRKVPGEQSKLTASAPVDVADEQLIIRVGSIGRSAFGHGFHKFG